MYITFVEKILRDPFNIVLVKVGAIAQSHGRSEVV
jgi:hypothetical protein